MWIYERLAKLIPRSIRINWFKKSSRFPIIGVDGFGRPRPGAGPGPMAPDGRHAATTACGGVCAHPGNGPWRGPEKDHSQPPSSFKNYFTSVDLLVIPTFRHGWPLIPNNSQETILASPKFKWLKILLLLLGWGSPVLVRGEGQAIYCHPTYMIVSAISDKMPFQIPLTYEWGVAPAWSIALQVSPYLGFTTEPAVQGITPPKTSNSGFSASAFLRRFFNGERSEGYYFAPSFGYFDIQLHRSMEIRNGGWFGGEDARGAGLSFMGYFGYRAFWSHLSIFSDLGFGYQQMTISRNISGVRSKVVGDMNLGIGIPF